MEEFEIKELFLSQTLLFYLLNGTKDKKIQSADNDSHYHFVVIY
ncbi:hypothetical protein RV06_GL002081 [Enterococcus haemoperoxidus]|nr:hypothetical protein RV06_GL002081 [Enterococcus haemoperoxidus]